MLNNHYLCFVCGAGSILSLVFVLFLFLKTIHNVLSELVKEKHWVYVLFCFLNLCEPEIKCHWHNHNTEIWNNKKAKYKAFKGCK